MSHRIVVPLLAAALALAPLPALAQSGSPPRAETGKRDWAERYLTRIDTERKGYATLADVERFADGQFTRLDTNGDGVVEHDEFLSPLKRALARARPATQDRLQHALDRRETLFRTLDQRGDGKLTREEYLAAARQHFAELDARKDGRVTGDELRAAHHGF